MFRAAARHFGTWKQQYFRRACTDKASSLCLILCDSEIAGIIVLIRGTNSGMNESNCWSRPMEAVPGRPPKDRIVSVGTSSSAVSVMSGVCKRVLSVVLLVDASSSVTDDNSCSAAPISNIFLSDFQCTATLQLSSSGYLYWS